MYLPIKIDGIGKIECAIDFYRLIDTIDINQWSKEFYLRV